MAKRRSTQAKIRAEKNLRKTNSMLKPGGNSKYAKKVAWCLANQKAAIDVPEPKPWNS